MNEKYDIVQIPMFKCCKCGKNVPEDSIILNNDRVFDCPHCNKTTLSQVHQQPKEKKLCVIYCSMSGKEVTPQNPSNPNARIKRYEMRSDFQNYELATNILSEEITN